MKQCRCSVFFLKLFVSRQPNNHITLPLVCGLYNFIFYFYFIDDTVISTLTIFNRSKIMMFCLPAGKLLHIRFIRVNVYVTRIITGRKWHICETLLVNCPIKKIIQINKWLPRFKFWSPDIILFHCSIIRYSIFIKF